MKRNNYFFKESIGGIFAGIMMLVAGIILMIVFYSFNQYAAMIFLGICLIFFILVIFSFVVVTDKSIKLFSFGKYKADIPLEGLQSINTQAGHPDTITFFGAGDMITCRYNSRILISVLEKTGVGEQDLKVFLSEGADTTIESGKWCLERENVLLDRLFGKKKYTHRRVICYEKSDISG